MYDPLTAPGPGEGLDHVPSYWQATADLVNDDGPLAEDVEVDVAIIGAGYTGLSGAYHLAAKHGATVAVLEANRPGWGCSGRNGGFVSPSIGRLSHGDWIGAFGAEGARELFREALTCLETVREVIRNGNIDCGVSSPGFLKIAHRPDRMAGLEAQHKLLREVFDFDTSLLSADDLRKDYFHGDEAFGALREPISFGVHPLKLALGLLRMARQAGAAVHSASPVMSWERDGANYLLRTPSGSARSTRVLIATNGYSTEALLPPVQGRILPVLSSIIVTRPMTDAEKAASLSTDHIMVDTRVLRPYYRRLDDDRIMFGCRGALRETTQGDAASRSKLLAQLQVKFPALRDMTIDYFWGGWVNITYDYMPRVHRLPDQPGVMYAMGYNGSGVSTSIQAGKWTAAALSGSDETVPAPLRSPLKKFPLPVLRRIGQRAMTAWFRFQDSR